MDPLASKKEDECVRMTEQAIVIGLPKRPVKVVGETTNMMTSSFNEKVLNFNFKVKDKFEEFRKATVTSNTRGEA